MTIAENLLKHKNDRNTGNKADTVTGLVVQGGGMRGAYSMGALLALEEAGLGKSFDHIWGSSAGAINAAYMLGEQSQIAVTVYTDDISNKNFINPFRLSKIVDIDFLVDIALTKIKPLNVDKVINSETTLHIALTDFLTGKSEYVTNHTPGLNLMEALRATAALPILYNKPIDVLGRKYIDGGVTDGIPIFKAIEAGCTDIIVVITRPTSYRRERTNCFMKMVEYPFTLNYTSEMRNTLFNIEDDFNQSMSFIENPTNFNRSINLVVIHPKENEQFASRTTRDPQIILQSALNGRRDTYQALNIPMPQENPFT